MSEWAEGYDAGYSTGTADGAKATIDFTKRRIAELETHLDAANELIEETCNAIGLTCYEDVAIQWQEFKQADWTGKTPTILEGDALLESWNGRLR